MHVYVSIHFILSWLKQQLLKNTFNLLICFVHHLFQTLGKNRPLHVALIV